MKKYFLLPLIAALAVGVACQKQQTEEERRAEVERQVQERLTAERLAADKDAVAKQQAELAAREKALADREAAAATTPAEEPPATSTEETTTTSETSETRSEAVSTETYGTFYEKLEPYGAWRETADYGYVWQPREAEESRDWRPYTEGRWAYSDAGWTWVSDESFGWATYHYGRWVRLRRVGWVWVPGNEWAPAWVSWRTSKDYVGWAPLPPEARFDRRHGIHNWADSYYDIGPDQYAFVRGEEFGGKHLRHSLVSTEQNVTIVLETTNVTNITFSNTTIINQGPNYDEIRSRSREPMERYRLRRNFEMNADFRSATVRGDEIEVSAPRLHNVAGFRRPRTIKERVSDVTVEDGWNSVKDRSAAERARTRIKTEATPPPNAPPKKFVRPTESAGGPSPSSTVAATVAPVATATPAPIATIAPTAHPSATVASTASPTPRVRQSPSITPRPTARPVASPSPTPVVAPSPTPVAVLSPTPAIPAVSPTPHTLVSPTVRPLPSPPISLRASPSVAPITDPAAAEKRRKLDEARKNKQLPNRPAPAASIAPLPPNTEQTLPVEPPHKTPPVLENSPPAVAPPASVPPIKHPTVAPRMKQAIPPNVSETTPAPVAPPAPPRKIPPRIAPTVTTPPPSDAAAPAVPPSAPPRSDAKPKDKKPKPGPLDAAIITPTPPPPPVPK